MSSRNNEAPQCANTNRASIENNLAGKIDMNIVAKTDFNFHGVMLTPVNNVPGIWLTSADVAKALGYKSTKSISNLFSQYEDEFSQGMTMVIESVTNGINGSSRRMKVRVFSLRGAHLIAMFARTPVAKEFRRWVLDILDREVTQSPIATRLSDDDIVSFCYLQIWMEKAQRVSKEIYPAIRQLGSEFSGIMYDLGNESRFVTKPTRDILMREIQNLDMNKVKSRNAEGMLRHFKDTKELH
nr:Bro-N domain-containing protein [Rosenbergiella epipactidis]